MLVHSSSTTYSEANREGVYYKNHTMTSKCATSVRRPSAAPGTSKTTTLAEGLRKRTVPALSARPETNPSDSLPDLSNQDMNAYATRKRAASTLSLTEKRNQRRAIGSEFLSFAVPSDGLFNLSIKDRPIFELCDNSSSDQD